MIGDDVTDVDDAILEDMAHCDWCGAPCDVSDITLFGSVALCDDCGDRDSAGLLVTVVRLRDALAFYADAANWRLSKDTPGSPWVTAGACWSDKGQRARAALGVQSGPAEGASSE